ncbi:MAG: Uncharacterized protein G01um1014107_143 [Parcubacteria group bacterium Gr01-1014_107]|nr:MAG: Uncharacterized protein G01um1014107_143 [Parcubacteria group bacterium Gr01-1014_107]
MDEGKSKERGNNEEGKSPIEKLQEGLYSRDKPPVLDEERYKFGQKPVDSVKSGWFPIKQATKLKIKRRFFLPFVWLKKALIIAAVFFVLAVSVSVFVIMGGLNLVSTRNVEIVVSGLTVIEAGEELVLDVALRNDNRVNLEEVTLTLEYPEGARDYLNVNSVLIRQEEKIELVPAREEVSKTFRSVLFGEQNSVKSIRIVAEYKTEGSGAVFTKEKIYDVGIRSSPLTVSISAPKEANAGQEVSLTLDISSNSTSAIKEILVSLDFPVGFTLSVANPSPDFENHIWRIKDFQPRDKKEIIIRGRLDGGAGEEKPFRIAVGLPNPENSRIVGVEFISLVESVTIKQPFIDLVADIGGSESGDYISKINQTIRVDIRWANNLPIDLNDVYAEVKIKGSALDRASVRPSRAGFYRSIDDTIIWNKNTFPEFSKVKAGQASAENYICLNL